MTSILPLVLAVAASTAAPAAASASAVGQAGPAIHTTAGAAPTPAVPTAEAMPPAGPGLDPAEGTARPPAAGADGVERQLRSMASPRAATARPLPTTYTKSTFTPRVLKDEELPYNSPAVYGYNRNVPRDSKGVRMALIGGKLYDHPVAQAQDGLMSLSDYRLTGEARYLDRALLDGGRLINRRVLSDEAWYYPYPFDFELHGNTGHVMRAPWFSAMAQGQALSLFVRLYRVTGEQRWLTAAEFTFNSFLNAPVQGRPSTVNIDSSGYLWLEEYPLWPTTASDRTLNGHVFAIFGLFDYQQLSNNPVAVDLWNGGLAMVRPLVQSKFRIVGWISRYCLTHPWVQAAGYHNVHRVQMLALHAETGDSGWSRISDALQSDYPKPEVAGRIALAAGTHKGLKFNSAGRITASKTITLSRASSAPGDRRQRIKGQRIYLRITAGSLAGYYVAENYQLARMVGAVAGVTYPLPRTASVPAGTWNAYQYTTTGVITSTRSLPLTATMALTFTASAVINGRQHILVTDGALAGHWLPTTSAITLL